MDDPMHQTDDLRIARIEELLPPVALLERFPLTAHAAAVVRQTRQDIHAILHDNDPRLLVVIGPCSIHDVKAANEYAERLLPLREKYREQLCLVMRVYFEKPRTTVGWKGLLNDPHLDGSFAINDGLRLGRELLLDLNEKGMPVAVEYLDMIIPQYIADLVSWGAIGARTTESQIHRQLASGLSCPIGFKNGTNGDVQIAIDAIASANAVHSFLSVTKLGHSAIVTTNGNEDCHLILRGGNDGPNYSAAHVREAVAALRRAGVQDKIMVDCSHANSHKQHKRQLDAAADVAAQIAAGERRITGVMIESHLNEGRQDIQPGQPLQYGVSVTDACLSMEQTIPVLQTLAQAVRKRRQTQGR